MFKIFSMISILSIFSSSQCRSLDEFLGVLDIDTAMEVTPYSIDQAYKHCLKVYDPATRPTAERSIWQAKCHDCLHAKNNLLACFKNQLQQEKSKYHSGSGRHGFLYLRTYDQNPSPLEAIMAISSLVFLAIDLLKAIPVLTGLVTDSSNSALRASNNILSYWGKTANLIKCADEKIVVQACVDFLSKKFGYLADMSPGFVAKEMQMYLEPSQAHELARIVKKHPATLSWALSNPQDDKTLFFSNQTTSLNKISFYLDRIAKFQSTRRNQLVGSSLALAIGGGSVWYCKTYGNPLKHAATWLMRPMS